jgi:hypothetical protein
MEYLFDAKTRRLPAGLKTKCRGAAVLRAAPGALAVPEAMAALREAADYCVAQGRSFCLAGLSPCLLPGYARYIAARGGKTGPCPRSAECFLAASCRGIPLSQAANAALFAPPRRGFTDLEKCMLAILSRRSGLTTAQVLKAARGIKICASCSNEGEVFRAAERLIRFGLVLKQYREGVYIWSKS